MTLLRFRRLEEGLSQTELAEMLDFTRTHINRIEMHPPAPHQVTKRLRRGLERVFGEPLEKLLSQATINEG